MEQNQMHVHEFEEVVVAPTCKEPGYTLYQCACGYAHKGNFQPVAAHAFQITEQIQPTCTEPGSVKRVCTVCAEVQHQALPPQGHQFGDWAVQAYPTCTELGKQIRSCSCCGAVEENTIPATGHRYIPGTERVVNGRMAEFFCANCGKTIVTDEKPQPQKAPVGRHLPTVISVLLSTFAAVVLLACLTVTQIAGTVKLSDLWHCYAFPAALLLGNGFIFVHSDRIGNRREHTPWLGIGALVYAANFALFLVNILEIKDDLGAYYWMNSYSGLAIRYGLCVAVLVMTAIFMFRGAKKTGWLSAVLLTFALISLEDAVPTVIHYVYPMHSFYENVTLAELGWRVSQAVVQVLVWVELAVLTMPGKNRKLKLGQSIQKRV